ncbi:hypothetical protein MSHOH_2240 [Methanosarcina horonobensis HB-1 = JCM 15518]|uniref:Uncharacterized protein n=1 Tax=Methanosarcina horonobensis HB-1 = JCM 15518 TaxID=1434110 RepID=A0A0E3SGM9_9EURY|nr:hypothetical protein [Methanosarcina horonobensis]AKB78723.1 hypothetical protein MSHOH_2240 [Methanosarcina horonobensis HB-1 = JCM 15518]
MVTSEARQKANLSRMKELMDEIENTTNDSALIAELNELLRKNYSLSLKWHLIIFKSEVERSLRYLEDIRKEEVKIASKSRKLGKELKEGPKQVYYKSSEIPSAFKLDYCLVYDTNINQYKWLRCNTPRNTRAKVFTIPKSMIGEYRLQWSEETKQKWGEDNIGQMELWEKAINN